MKIWVHFVVVTFGLILVAFGLVLHTQFPSMMSKKLGAMLVISEDSPTLGNFISPPIPIYMQFYFFNVTNAADILEGAKPKVKEIGPYTYLETRLKHDLNWTSSTVEYFDTTAFFFQPKLSPGLTEDDLITTINPVMMTLAAKLANPSVPAALHGVFEFIKYRFSMDSFITRRAGELLFKGYQEDVLLELAKLTKNPIHETGKFGFFYPKNDTDGGKYSVHTGAEGLETLQLIASWKNSSTLDYWPEEHCNMINGTTGSQFPQPILPERNISMFSADLCRSLYLSYEKTIERGGLELYRYSLPYEVLANRPENLCYCSDNFTCKASMVNLSPCRGGAPVVASTPHFYMADKETISSVDGLHPVKEYHETYLDIEPNTGVSFEAMKRIQISMPLKRYADLPELAKVQEVILPILWLNESAKVPDERAQALHVRLTRPKEIVQYVCYVLYAVGAVLLLLPIVLTIISKYSKKTDNEDQTTVTRSNEPMQSDTASKPMVKATEWKDAALNEETQPFTTERGDGGWDVSNSSSKHISYSS